MGAQDHRPRHAALAEHLVQLDDVYDSLEYTDMTEQDINTEIITEARRVVESRHSPID